MTTVYPTFILPIRIMATLADFVDLVQTCKNHGVLFAPHDNYIDLYPDAEDFSYDDVTFNPVGQPVRAYPNMAPLGRIAVLSAASRPGASLSLRAI